MSLHPHFTLKAVKENILPQKFSGNELPELAVLLAIISTRNRRERRKKERKKEKPVYPKEALCFCLCGSAEEYQFSHNPLHTCVCIKGNKCIMFPAFILKLATVFLIWEFHMVPETQNNFLLVTSSAKLQNTLLLATKWLLG